MRSFISVLRIHKALFQNEKQNYKCIHMKVEASDVYPCLISGLDNCIKRDLIGNDVI